MILALARHIERMPRSGVHVLAAESIGLAKEILGHGGSGLGIINYFGARATERQVNKQDAIVIDMGGGITHTLYYKGHSKSNSWTSLRGMTIDTITITEASIAHPSFITEAQGRTSSADPKYRRLSMDLNPTAASAPIYTDFINPWTDGRLEMSDGVNFMTCSLFDNPSFTEEKKKSILSEYDQDSPVFKALIMGERISSANLVYYLKDYNILAGEIPPMKEVIMSVDVGITQSATTIATLGLGLDNKIYLLDMYYHRNGKEDFESANFMTQDHYAKEVIRIYENWSAKGLNIKYVFTDHDITFIRILTQAFVNASIPKTKIARAFKRKIDDRISLMTSLIYKGEFMIVNNENNKLSKRAFDEAVYDDKEFIKGKIVRLDNTNLEFNPIDVLDSIEYGATYFWTLKNR